MSEDKKKDKISKEDMEKILKAFIDAKEASGKIVSTALLYTDEEEPEILYDARKEEDLH